MLLQLYHCLYAGAVEPGREGGREFGPQLELGIYIVFFLKISFFYLVVGLPPTQILFLRHCL